nr:MAG TPA: hypothetical protein [Caudoviricetes sp.]
MTNQPPADYWRFSYMRKLSSRIGLKFGKIRLFNP